MSASETRYFEVRIMPYQTLDSLIDGVVITCVDITQNKQVKAGLKMTQIELGKV